MSDVSDSEIPRHAIPQLDASLLERLLDTAPIGIAFVDREFRFARVSRKLAEIDGLPAADHIGRTVEEVLGPGYWPAAEAVLKNALQGEATCDREVSGELPRHPGVTFHGILSVYPVTQDGLIIGVGVVIVDTTHLRQAERAASRQMRNILESISDGFASLDRDLRYRYVNAAAERILKQPREALIGRKVNEVFPGGRNSKFSKIAREALETRSARISVQRAGHAGIWIESRIFPSEDSLSVYFRDVTHEREEEMRRRVFVKDMLASVTGGRLILCQNESDLPPERYCDGGKASFARDTGLHQMRQLSAAAALEADLAPSRVLDLLTAVSEAGMNAIVHGGGTGRGSVSYDPGEGIVQVRIADSGAGISMEHLPRAAFREGYTTAGTMGFGFKLILQTIDRVWLLTGTKGTILVIEQGRIAPGIAWA